MLSDRSLFKQKPKVLAIPAIAFKSFSDQLATFTTQLFNNILTQKNSCKLEYW